MIWSAFGLVTLVSFLYYVVYKRIIAVKWLQDHYAKQPGVTFWPNCKPMVGNLPEVIKFSKNVAKTNA